MADPILAHIDEVPTATFLTLVGTSSAEYMNTTVNPCAIKNLPNDIIVKFSSQSSETNLNIIIKTQVAAT